MKRNASRHPRRGLSAPISLLGLVVVSVLAPRGALAAGQGGSQPTKPRAFSVRLSIDAALIGAALPLMIVPNFINTSRPDCDPCDRAELNALDRTVVGNDSATAKRISDVMLFSLPPVALTLALLTGPSDDRWPTFLEDAVMLAQAVVIAGALQQLFSLAIRRPRPFMYVPDARPDERQTSEAARSFYSGHVSVSFALAATFAYIYTVRRPKMRARWLVWLIAMAVVAPMPFMRTAAGLHFWTDEIVSATVGIGVGLLVPALHRVRSKVRLAVGPGGLALAGSF